MAVFSPLPIKLGPRGDACDTPKSITRGGVDFDVRKRWAHIWMRRMRRDGLQARRESLLLLRYHGRMFLFFTNQMMQNQSALCKVEY